MPGALPSAGQGSKGGALVALRGMKGEPNVGLWPIAALREMAARERS